MKKVSGATILTKECRINDPKTKKYINKYTLKYSIRWGR